MPRATAPSVRTAELPEFLRSTAVGRVIAEALDASTDDELTRPGAVTEMIGDAAREIREFHGLPEPDQRTDPHRFGIVSNESASEHEAHG